MSMTTSSKNLILQPGDTVTGTYFGARFYGEVISHRGHTLNWNVLLVSVRLTADMHVLDRIEPAGGVGIQVPVSYDGSPAEGWGECTLEVVR